MGAEPKIVLNLLAMPSNLGPQAIGAVLQGASKVVHEAGALTMGGHTIEDAEPKFGLSCLGLAPLDQIIQNSGARAGDLLYLTKALGTGIMTTAFKRGKIDKQQLTPVIESMATLNKHAAQAMCEAHAHAATDITGFGLAGHLHELCEASNVAAHLYSNKLRFFSPCIDLAKEGIMPGKTRSIQAWAKDFLRFGSKTYTLGDKNVSADEYAWLLCDPQTSGGMLISLAQDKAGLFEEIYEKLSGEQAICIGEIIASDTNNELTPGDIWVL